MGYFIWQNQCLKVARSTLQLSLKLGELQLKSNVLQRKALLLHRTAQVLCDYPNSFAAQMKMVVLNRIELDLPLNVLTWKDIIYYLNEQFQEAYRIQITNYTVKLYSHEFHFISDCYFCFLGRVVLIPLKTFKAHPKEEILSPNGQTLSGLVTPVNF